ncbi:MAG: ribokinase [Oscillospiraceae bacterium]|nr:ribokinase [Oscillospiraceae bacterium]
MLNPRILVVSSANMDVAAYTYRTPVAGQTVIGDTYDFIPGGKGANAAITLSRLGGDSVFCAKLGHDPNGTALMKFYDTSGIDTRFISLDRNEKTGLAIIIVETNGNNRIIVYPGANFKLSVSNVEDAFTCYPDALFLHLEIPVETVIAATQFAKDQGIPIFIDAGPATKEFPLEELAVVEVFSPNETETQVFTGVNPTTPEMCVKACMALANRIKAKYYVIKLGERGAFLYDGKFYKMLAPYDVDVVDTTAAGDAFTAALTLEYMRSGDIKRACEYANIVGSLTVSKAGASPSLPTAAEVKRFVIENEINFKL